jgi:hypothetical protein
MKYRFFTKPILLAPTDALRMLPTKRQAVADLIAPASNK